NTGHPGGVATIHANSAYAGLIRLEQLISEVTQSPMASLIGEAVNMVVYIEKHKGSRRIGEILYVKGHNGSGYKTQSLGESDA
ncbi:MAG TPA: conjugal transfer protein TrbB, partial [Nitrosospira sp.]